MYIADFQSFYRNSLMNYNKYVTRWIETFYTFEHKYLFVIYILQSSACFPCPAVYRNRKTSNHTNFGQSTFKGLIFMSFLGIGGISLLLILQTFDYQKQSIKGVFITCFFFVSFLGYSAKNEKVTNYFCHFLSQKRLAWLPIQRKRHKINNNQVQPEN